MDYLDLIARITTHIQDKGQVMIRYYGIHSNAHRRRGEARFGRPRDANNPTHSGHFSLTGLERTDGTLHGQARDTGN
jgi:hypothetical protein